MNAISSTTFQLDSLADLRLATPHRTDWLWHGFLAAGNITLLTSQWKTGKTTFVSILLSKLAAGGLFLGLPVRPGKVAIVSEEAKELWLTRSDKLHFGAQARWICRPFLGKPQFEEWSALIDFLAGIREREGLDLVVIDPLAAFLPGRSENDAATIMEAMLPLRQLTQAGVSILILHHPKKGKIVPGQGSRGSGALTSWADIIVEMSRFSQSLEDDRRRSLFAFSRHEETPRRMLVELEANGTDYLIHGDFANAEFEREWPVLLGVLEDARGKKTRREILDEWPADFTKPSQSSLWKWLAQALTEGRIQQEGTGRKTKPFRYWLPGQEKKWAGVDLPPLPKLEPLTDFSPRRMLDDAERVLLGRGRKEGTLGGME